MKRTTVVGLALAMVLLGAAATGTASAESAYEPRIGNEMEPMDHDRGGPTERWGDRTRAGGIDLEGRWIAKRGYNPPPRAYSRGAAGLAGALPPRLVIDQRRNVIRVEDFKGRVLQQIVIADKGPWRANRGAYVLGQWRDSKLLTIRSGFRNTRIIQTFALANRGRTLVVHTRQDGAGTRNDFEFTSVYRRA